MTALCLSARTDGRASWLPPTAYTLKHAWHLAWIRKGDAGNAVGNLLCGVPGVLDNPGGLARLLNEVLGAL